MKDPYLTAFRTALSGAADAGANLAGGSVKDDVVDDLVESLTQSLLDPLRDKIERIVTDAADKNEVTEPLRAHYRKRVRTNYLTWSTTLLLSAFALGHFTALKSGTSVVWLADPRFDAGPDCYDNTLAGSVKKSEKFPTGHTVPPGSPGCRCLVLAAS